MMKSKDTGPNKDWINKKLAKFREELESGGDWSTRMDQMVQSLFGTQPSLLHTNQEDDMLSALIYDAHNGVDIMRKYPAFFRILEEYEDLQEAFLDALEMLEQKDNLAPPPGNVLKPPSFSKERDIPKPIFKNPKTKSWPVSWQLRESYITSRFVNWDSPNAGYSATRSTHLDLKNDGTILLRSQFEIENSSLDLFLEAIQIIDDPAHFHLFLYVTKINDPSSLPSLKAHLIWGAFKETSLLNHNGQARFTPVYIPDLVDEDGERFSAELKITLEIAGL